MDNGGKEFDNLEDIVRDLRNVMINISEGRVDFNPAHMARLAAICMNGLYNYFHIGLEYPALIAFSESQKFVLDETVDILKSQVNEDINS